MTSMTYFNDTSMTSVTYFNDFNDMLSQQPTVDVTIHLSIKVGMRDVNRVQVVVLECCNGKDNSNGRHSDSRGENLNVVKARTLVIAFGS